MVNGPDRNRQQKGNVLFLVLLAIVLFIALSYAVMHLYSDEQPRGRRMVHDPNIGVVQYSSAIRTGVTRMLLRNQPTSQLNFTAPLDNAFANMTDDQKALLVFHPDGGGVTYAPVNPDIVTNVEKDTAMFSRTQNGNWYFSFVRIAKIGSSEPDLVAMLRGVRRSVCQDINEQVTGSATIPELPGTALEILRGDASLAGSLIEGQPVLCIKSATQYIYYHVLAEQ